MPDDPKRDVNNNNKCALHSPTQFYAITKMCINISTGASQTKVVFELYFSTFVRLNINKNVQKECVSSVGFC